VEVLIDRETIEGEELRQLIDNFLNSQKQEVSTVN
jgi:hypothetical protein